MKGPAWAEAGGRQDPVASRSRVEECWAGGVQGGRPGGPHRAWLGICPLPSEAFNLGGVLRS